MIDIIGFIETIRTVIYILISFAFFVGILLLVSQEAFDAFNNELQREYGVKKRFFPKIEDSSYHFVDFILLKHRFIAGLLIAIVSFILLLIYK